MCLKLILILLIYSIDNCKAFRINKNLLATLNSFNGKNISMDDIENNLAKPLRNVKHLHVKLRSTHYQQDAENIYTKWFLQQILVPITISKYDLIKNNTNMLFSDNSRNNYVIVTSMEDLRDSARQFGNRAGIFFFIVNGDIDFKEIRNIFYMGWKHLLIFKNFLLTDRGILIYDPFELNESGKYGKIIKYSGKETIERTLFYNMRGYPLRVQLFKSVYSKPIIDPVTKKVKSVYGVDGRVAKLLQEHMNFTMNLQDPDPNYFG